MMTADLRKLNMMNKSKREKPKSDFLHVVLGSTI